MADNISLFPANLDTFTEILYSTTTSASNIVHADIINKLSSALSKIEKAALYSILTDRPALSGASGEVVQRFVGIGHVDASPTCNPVVSNSPDCYVNTWKNYETIVSVSSGNAQLPIWDNDKYAIYIRLFTIGKNTAGSMNNITEVPVSIVRYIPYGMSSINTMAQLRASIPFSAVWTFVDVMVIGDSSSVIDTASITNILTNPGIESPWPDTTYLQNMSSTALVTPGSSGWALITRPWGPMAYVDDVDFTATPTYCEYCYYPINTTYYTGRYCGCLQPEYRPDSIKTWSPTGSSSTWIPTGEVDFGFIDDSITGRRWTWGQLINLDNYASSGTTRTYKFSMMYKLKYPPKTVWSPSPTLSYYCDLNLHVVGYDITAGEIEPNPAGYAGYSEMVPTWWINTPSSGNNCTCKTLTFRDWPYWDAEAGNEPTKWLKWETTFTVPADVVYLRLAMEFVSRGSQRPGNDFFNQTRLYFDHLELIETESI